MAGPSTSWTPSVRLNQSPGPLALRITFPDASTHALRLTLRCRRLLHGEHQMFTRVLSARSSQEAKLPTHQCSHVPLHRLASAGAGGPLPPLSAQHAERGQALALLCRTAARSKLGEVPCSQDVRHTPDVNRGQRHQAESQQTCFASNGIGRARRTGRAAGHRHRHCLPRSTIVDVAANMPDNSHTGEAIVSATDFWAAFLTSFLGPIAPWFFISATTSSRAKTPLTTLCAE